MCHSTAYGRAGFLRCEGQGPGWKRLRMADQGHQGPLSRELGGQQGPPPGWVVSASLAGPSLPACPGLRSGPGQAGMCLTPWQLRPRWPCAAQCRLRAAGRGARGLGSAERRPGTGSGCGVSSMWWQQWLLRHSHRAALGSCREFSRQYHTAAYFKGIAFLLEKSKNYSPCLRCKGAYVNYEGQNTNSGNCKCQTYTRILK